MRENLGGGFGHGLLSNSGLLFVKVTDGECSKSLHKTGSVVASWGVTKGKHGLGEFSVELGLGIAQGRFNINKFLDVVEGSVTNNNTTNNSSGDDTQTVSTIRTNDSGSDTIQLRRSDSGNNWIIQT